MAGIYIHVPFCRKRCFYCDFYKTTRIEFVQQYLDCLKKEILLRKDYLNGRSIKTIYFGGGTPSVLKISDVDSILNEIAHYFSIDGSAEITFEVNPDDIKEQYLSEINRSGINRLSLGVQSFVDDHLKIMNRRHNGDQAKKALALTAEAGFKNISIDLIFAIPGMNKEQLKQNLEIMIQYPVNHFSAYYLTVHKGTMFHKMVNSGKLFEIDEDEGLDQFGLLIDFARESGFEHYEISNFARNREYSKHNTAYWSGVEYLGLGPSAHSFNGSFRQWNVSETGKYMERIRNNGVFYKSERLSAKDKYNEYIMTALRTMWGVDTRKMTDGFDSFFCRSFSMAVSELIEQGLIRKEDTCYTLTRQGIFVSDKVISSLFVL